MRIASRFLPAATAPAHRAVGFHDCIARRARILWMIRGRPGGCDLAIWLEAERRLFSRRRRGPVPTIQARLRAGYAAGPGHRSTTSL